MFTYITYDLYTLKLLDTVFFNLWGWDKHNYLLGICISLWFSTRIEKYYRWAKVFSQLIIISSPYLSIRPSLVDHVALSCHPSCTDFEDLLLPTAPCSSHTYQSLLIHSFISPMYLVSLHRVPTRTPQYSRCKILIP